MNIRPVGVTLYHADRHVQMATHDEASCFSRFCELSGNWEGHDAQ